MSRAIEQTITDLEAQKLKVADEAMRQGNADLFKYGRFCGIYQGVEAALKILRANLDEPGEKGDTLSKSMAKASQKPDWQPVRNGTLT